MTLKELKIGQTAVITAVGGEGSLRQHFLDMGVIPGAEVTLTKFAPMGDPMELMIHGYELTLRLDDAEKIDIDQESVTGGEDDRHRSEDDRHRSEDDRHRSEDERRWNGSRHDDNSRMAGNTLTAAAGNIPDWEKKAAIMSKPTPARCRKEQR